MLLTEGSPHPISKFFDPIVNYTIGYSVPYESPPVANRHFTPRIESVV